jgi:RNA polymerase sigma-70 factor (ECF subfamily)
MERLEPPGQEHEDRDTAALVARIQAGEHHLFADLYTRYFDRVYGYLRIALRNPADAEDVAQQVFASVLVALPRYEHREEQPFRGWLFTIVRNHTLKHLRRKGGAELVDSEGVASELDARQRSEPAELQALGWISDPELILFIERLPLAQRQVLLLRYGLDFTHAQIAEILGRSPSDVRALQTRAQSFLRQRLAALEVGAGVRRRDRPLRRCPRQAPVIRMRRWALTSR